MAYVAVAYVAAYVCVFSYIVPVHYVATFIDMSLLRMLYPCYLCCLIPMFSLCCLMSLCCCVCFLCPCVV